MKLGGHPVSPISNVEGTDLRIQTGSQSLESTLSDEKKFKLGLIDNKAKEQEKQQKQGMVDEISQDLFNMMMTELKIELDLLLMRRRNNPIEEGTFSFFIHTDTSKFLIFERKGIQTDLFAIEHYVEEILQEILSNF